MSPFHFSEKISVPRIAAHQNNLLDQVSGSKLLFGGSPINAGERGEDHDIPPCYGSYHLTAAIVSNDPDFGHKVLGSTVNGTTYLGICARTTGVPQQHWFGPAGDPRAGGIRTVEAIQQTWTCHRGVVVDMLVPHGWVAPHCT